ncbi:unnamed protein product [Adineta ricciae]|uniref:Uncharacterized protein n=1 Tax=Adineta ricciae TaxID=249248 RepID=A0A813WZG4_ADIRI|nr:unnamed protein product [Adineta ricciae]
MNNQIETFLNYLLDTESTSEMTFYENISKSSDLFHIRYLKDWEQTVLRTIQQVHRFANVSTSSHVDNGQNSELTMASSSEEDDDDDDTDEKQNNNQNKSSSNGNSYLSNKATDFYVDTVRQCQRLLRLLHYCQQKYPHFTSLYYDSLEQYRRSDIEKIVLVVLQQIATHLFEGAKTPTEQEQLTEKLSLMTRLSYQPILATIQSLLSSDTNEINTTNFLSKHLDVLYPRQAAFLDVRQEFRDTAQYLIDGDSLLLSMAHHTNIHLNSSFGNTLHLIFLIERFLYTLFQQSHKCNYTLVFFECHYHCYQEYSPILSLIRACLIAHLSENVEKIGKIKIKRFASWYDDRNYLQFTREERPLFVFYHDMSTFDQENDSLLSKDVLAQLLCIYHCFGNYHQYVVQCQLYLMNKFTLTETSVKCFQIQFDRDCPKKLFDIVMAVTSFEINTNAYTGEQKQQELENLCEDDARLYLYLQTIADFNEKPFLSSLNPLLILHVALLIRLSLIDRHLPLSVPSIETHTSFSQSICQFQQRLALNLSARTSKCSQSKIADLFDGRLFIFTLYQIHQSATVRLDSRTNQILQRSLEILHIPFSETLLQDTVNQLVQSNYISFCVQPINGEHTKTSVKQTVLQISNPFVDAYLKPLFALNGNTVAFDLIPAEDRHILQCRGKHSWETYKETGDEIDRIRDNDTAHNKSTNHRFRTKHVQKLYDYFDLYGKSLATRDIRDHQYRIILPTASTPAQQQIENTTDRAEAAASAGKKKQQHKNQPKKAQPTKAEKIIEQNTKRLLDKRTDDEAEKVKNVEAQLKQFRSDDYVGAINLIDGSLENFETATKRLEILKKKFDLQRKFLRSFRKKTNLTNEERSQFELLQIGFFATLCEMTHLENLANAFDANTKFMEELVNESPLEAENWYRFQMEKINSRLPRRGQGEPDQRLPDFIPDPWQVKFLDAVDKQQSIIIVAPTASGKTYASYYAMGKVLKDKDDTTGICVYVAPTKALVNQVAGTIQMKFGPVFGIFMKEFRMITQACRILITVPECLEMLLLSASYQRRCQKIRYCIFDEIHCMSDDTNSDVWERTMLLINCPMIGLSATVNNGEALRDWITYVEQKRAKLFNSTKPLPVCYISHHERLADLNKYLYSNRQLYPLHPVSLMNAKQLTTRGLPDDFSLSPCETLRLTDAVQQTNVQTEPVPTLTEHFSPGWIAERNRCNEYSQLVCRQFRQLIDTKQTSTIDSISASLNPTTSNKISYPEVKPISSLIGEFVLTLKEKNLLPCIVFTDSRALCEELSECVAVYFEELEKELRQTKYKHQIEALEKRRALIEKMQKTAKAKQASKSASKRGNDDEDQGDKPGELKKMEEEDQLQFCLSGPEQELLDGVVEEGTLANRFHCDRDLVKELTERVSASNPKLIRYMERGVAYHHEQLNNRTRLSVEGLFRHRYVQIVFSTWTLALGVHMPTKTVAFIKDSIQLDALQYRQSSGRAGRRGFDVQGNIIFIDIPIPKIRHLTISAIPDIQTRNPISVTFLMRLLHLYSNAEDKKDAVNRSLVALQCPFSGQTSHTQEIFAMRNRFHCLHTLDFLYRLNLINEQGDLIGLAGFLKHLYHVEPADILFIHLLDTQLFHQMHDEEKIVNLLAHLFTNMPSFMVRQDSNETSTTDQQPSRNPIHALRPLSADIRRRIQSYNSLVKDIYGSYIENVNRYMRSLNTNQECILPLSNVEFLPSSDYDNGTFEYNLHHHHSQQSQNPSISPFVGPSGLTHQQYISNYNPTVASWDLAYNLDLSPRIVPFVDIDAHDHTNASYYLNSYVLDYFRHGSEKVLHSENNLSRGQVYALLFDFRKVLTSVKTSLEEILAAEPKIDSNRDLEFFKPLHKKLHTVEEIFSGKFHRDYK